MVYWYNSNCYEDADWVDNAFTKKHDRNLRDLTRKILGHSAYVMAHFRYMDSEPDAGEDSVKMFYIDCILANCVYKDLDTDEKMKLAMQAVKEYFETIGFDLSTEKSAFVTSSNNRRFKSYIKRPEQLKKAVAAAREIFGTDPVK